jgi:hypothetical protein
MLAKIGPTIKNNINGETSRNCVEHQHGERKEQGDCSGMSGLNDEGFVA